MESWVKREAYEVKSWDVDYSGRMTLAALARYFQESAHKHAESLGFGYQRMLKNGMAWVLSRIQIRIIEAPVWNSDIIVETWPKGKDQLMYLRDYRLEDAKGNHMGSATSSWLLIDVKSRRPKSFKPLDVLAESVSDRHSIRTPAPRLGPVSGPFMHTSFKVRYSDVDVNGHMNFVQYVRWMEDLLHSGTKEFRQVKELNVNFLSELHFDDMVDIQMDYNIGDRTSLFSFVSKDLNTESARGSILCY